MDNVLGPIEIFRRAMWAVFRVENEHVHSTDGHRRENFVPLLFETPIHEPEREPPAKVRGWMLIAETVGFAAVVLLLGIVAIVVHAN